MSLLFALLLAQVGPAVTSNPQPASSLPPELRDRPDKRSAAKDATTVAAEPSELQACLDLENPVDAVDAANDWLTRAKGAERATAGECLGVALSRLERWDEAAHAFSNAHAAATAAPWRARLGAMAGEAALNAGDAQAALAALDKAKADAGGDVVMQGGLALYRARALVALRRDDDAAGALADARRLAPDSAQAWLLSATLSRRQGKLAEAQQQIERAFDLRPIDLQIGLEAGVIAVLSGRDEAARRSWQSVIAAAPDSAEAGVARGYIAQLDPVSAKETGR